MNFCRTFRNTALKEIGKIYAVQGRKFLLSFPAPYTCDQFKARGLSSWLAQSASSTQHMWELLAENRTAVLPRQPRRRRIRSYPDLSANKFNKTNLKQGAHIHQPTASSTSRMRTTCVFFFVLLSRGFSRLPQRESLVIGYIHSSYSHNRNFSRWNESAGNLVEYLIKWPLLMKLRTWVSSVCPRQSAISSLSNLWATESMRMNLTAIDCERTGNRWLLQSW